MEVIASEPSAQATKYTLVHERTHYVVYQDIAGARRYYRMHRCHEWSLNDRRFAAIQRRLILAIERYQARQSF